MDFLKINHRYKKDGSIEVYPTFIVCKSKDLMIRGSNFYSIWDEDNGFWSTDFYRAIEIIDNALDKYADENFPLRNSDDKSKKQIVYIKYLRESDSGSIDKWNKYIQKQLDDNYHLLDKKIIFANTEVKKTDYATRKLSYNLEDGPIDAWNEIVSTNWDPPERHKIEWAIGSVVSGDSKKLQKFFVLYGSGGTGKSTILKIITKLFEGYCIPVKVKDLVNSASVFSLEQFKSNPLVAIDHEGDLSRINDNTRLNSVVSHDEVIINEKYKSQYPVRLNTLLFIATNNPVKITDAKSGLLRRLIDIHPSGRLIPQDRYTELMDKIDFELGGIAYHCLQVYLENKKYYSAYRPRLMMDLTNTFYNFVSLNYDDFLKDDSTTTSYAWDQYKKYCEDANIKYPLEYQAFKAELKNYFRNFDDRVRDKKTGERVRNYYSGFRHELFEKEVEKKPEEKKDDSIPDWLDFKEQHSLFDDEFKDRPAQYEAVYDGKGQPQYKWANVKTKLKDIKTSVVHYVKVPENLIVLDFDIKGDDGKKNFEKNAEAAKKFPKTYGELSKSGEGIHLHYWYDGDVNKLAMTCADNVEIKTFPADKNMTLRRKLTKCNDVPIAKLNSGLPLKGEGRKVVNKEAVMSERTLRRNITKVVNKEMDGVPSTASGVALIKKMLDEAYDSGKQYDVSDMHDAVLYFGMNSTHQADNCLKMISQMKFKSEEIAPVSDVEYHKDALNFFDIEVFPNYMCICSIPVSRDDIIKYTKMDWKDFLVALEELRPKVVKDINPDGNRVRELSRMQDVGFNCRRYDNHICYARQEGYSLKQCYDLSQKIINDHNRDNFFNNAYDWSYTDVYDFCSKKQSLKKWEIELGINHLENEYPWDEDLSEDHWDEVANYCVNDVLATLAVFVKRHGDFVAREILSALSGLNVNATTNQHTTRIIFGTEKHPGLVYTDLSTGKSYGPGEHFEMPIVSEDYYIQHMNDWVSETKSMNPPKNCFPGYFLMRGKDGRLHNMYRGVDLGFGGYVYASPGMYLDGAVTEDVASEHPHSIKELNLFGDHTQKFVDLMEARICIKHKDYEGAKKLFDGKLAPYLDDPAQAKALSQALKIAINSVYGLTSAKFDNAFRDKRNVNNIVALRGALFMKTVQDAVEAEGYHVIHIKTDSIKIEKPDNYILNKVIDMGHQYGYDFEVEHTWDRLCLVNNAVFIGRHGKDDPESPGVWDAVGTQFQIPYVFKTLFSHEEIKFEDMCETKSVTSALYLDCREGLPDVSKWEELKEIRRKIANGSKVTNRAKAFAEENSNLSDEELNNYISKGHNLNFVGKVGSFCPMQKGCGAGELLRKSQDRNGNDKLDSATGAKWTEDGHEVNRWLEANVVRTTQKEKFIDRTYYRNLVDEAVASISEFGSFEEFIA